MELQLKSNPNHGRHQAHLRAGIPHAGPGWVPTPWMSLYRPANVGNGALATAAVEVSEHAEEEYQIIQKLANGEVNCVECGNIALSFFRTESRREG